MPEPSDGGMPELEAEEPASAAVEPDTTEVAAAEPAAVAPRPLVKRHHGVVRVTHWLNAALLVGMIGSGPQLGRAP